MHPKFTPCLVRVGLALVVAVPPAFAVTTTGVTNTYNGSTASNGLTTGTNWTQGSPFFSDGPGAYSDLVFTGTSGSTFLGAGTAPNMNAESFNVTNGSSYTLQLTASSTTLAATFRTGSTPNATGTAELIQSFTNSVSGVAQDLIFLSNGSDLTFNATNTAAGGLPSVFQVKQAGNYNIGSGSVLTFNTAISGNVAVTINGAGRVVYNAANSSTALTTINGGTLELGATNVIANTAPITVAGGTLDIKSFSDTVGAVAISSGSITGTSGKLTGSSYTATGSGTIGAILAGAGVTFAKSGEGTLILTGANEYTGATTISGGTLQIGNGGTSGTIGANSNASIGTGARLLIERSTDSFGYGYSGILSGSGTVEVPASRRFNLLNTDQTQSGNLAFVINGNLGIQTVNNIPAVHLGELSGSGSIIRSGTNNNPNPSTTLVIGGRNTDSIFSGTISTLAEFALEKVGTGTLALSGANYGHGSGTTVTGGTLLVNGTFSNATNAVTVGTSGTLGGTGSIAGATTVNGRLAPGNGIGTLGVAGLAFGSGSVFAWEMNYDGAVRGTNYDAVNVSGLLSGSGATFAIVLPGTTDFGDDFWKSNRTWSDIFGANSIVATFKAFSYANANGAISAPDFASQGSFGLDGSSLVWTAIPEPGAFAALAGLAVLGGAVLRRRR